MVLMKQPKTLPSELSYVPANSVSYAVSESDSWYSLADQPNVRAAGMSANDLCYFNFKTRTATEINWYLKNKVGCWKTTKDGKNFRFSNSDKPGIIYLPALAVVPPPNEYPAAKPEDIAMDIWIGVGAKGGVNFFVVGLDLLEALVFRLEQSASAGTAVRYAMLHGESNRVGPGAGVGGGMSILIAFGIKDPQEFHQLQTGPSSWKDFDFNVSVGGKLDKFAKSGKLAKFAPVVELFVKLGAKTPEGLMKILKNLNSDNVALITKTMLAAKSAAGVDGERTVLVIDTPAGGGTELSIFYAITTFTLMTTGTFQQ